MYSTVSQVDSKMDQGRNNLGSVQCILFYVSLQTCGSVWGSITFLSSMVNQKIIPVAFGKDTFTKYNFIISTIIFHNSNKTYTVHAGHKLMLDHCQENVAKQMPIMVSEDFYYLDTDWAASVECRCCPSNNVLFADRASGRRLQVQLENGTLVFLDEFIVVLNARPAALSGFVQIALVAAYGDGENAMIIYLIDNFPLLVRAWPSVSP